MVDWIIVHGMLVSFGWLIVALDASRSIRDRGSGVPVAIGSLFLTITSLLLGAIIVSMGAVEWILVSVIPLAAAIWVLRRRMAGVFGSGKPSE